MSAPTLVLTQADVHRLLDLDTCISAVEEAFRLYGAGDTEPPSILGVHVPGGGFHVKAGVLRLDRPYFAAKCNGNFPSNPAARGLPTIQGVLILADAESGAVLALMESGSITVLRTAAASAVAAKYLARESSSTVGIIGCGLQGAEHLRAVARVRPIKQAFLFDRDPRAAERLARRASADLGIDARPVNALEQATFASDIIVTTTPATQPILRSEHVRPGTFISAVGADNPDKSEIEPGLMRQASVVVDLLSQASTIGDLHHAIAADAMGPADVRAELGEIVAGKRPGRESEDEIILFDSTGMALQDVAAAAAVYERALAAGEGLSIPLTPG